MIKTIATSLLCVTSLAVLGCAAETSTPSSSSEVSEEVTTGTNAQPKPQDPIDDCLRPCNDARAAADAHCVHLAPPDRAACQDHAQDAWIFCAQKCT